MPIRSILTAIDGTDRARPAMETAFTLGRDLTAHVTVLHVSADERDSLPLVGEGVSGPMVEDLLASARKEIEERRDRARAMFDTFCERYHVPLVEEPPAPDEVCCAWAEEVGLEDAVLARRGRLADLLVVARPDGGDGSRRAALNAALFDTGRPVLVAPDTAPTRVGRHVAVAWNDSREAARAVAAAMPLLLRAEAVSVLTATAGDPADAAAGPLLDALAWHGIEAGALAVEAGSEGVGAGLLGGCREVGADLLVMGAYSHSRMRELILGGVTRHVLENAEIPALMAH